MTRLAAQRMGIETFAAPELNVPMYATVRLSAIAFFAFSDSCAASHDCFAAVASSRASNSIVVVPTFRGTGCSFVSHETPPAATASHPAWHTKIPHNASVKRRQSDRCPGLRGERHLPRAYARSPTIPLGMAILCSLPCGAIGPSM